MGEKRETYVRKLKGNIDKWNDEIDKFQARADSTKSDVKVKYRCQVNELKTKRQELEGKMTELQKDGGAAWDDVTTGVDAVRDALVESILVA